AASPVVVDSHASFLRGTGGVKRYTIGARRGEGKMVRAAATRTVPCDLRPLTATMDCHDHAARKHAARYRSFGRRTPPANPLEGRPRLRVRTIDAAPALPVRSLRRRDVWAAASRHE